MEKSVRFNIKLPYITKELVDSYKKVLEVGKEYNVYTLDDDINIIECKGFIKSDGSWNYHNNYDDSQDTLFILNRFNNQERKWFTLNHSEIEKIRDENREEYIKVLENELKRFKK